MTFDGTHMLMWKDMEVAELEFKNNYFYRIKTLYHRDKLPYFLETQISEDYLLSLFFSERTIHIKNPCYKILQQLEWYRFISLFDDYWVKTDDLTYDDIKTYTLEKDCVYHILESNIKREYLENYYSPNLSLYAMDRKYFQKEEDKIYLLVPYNKENVLKYKKYNIPYETIIYHHVPYLKIHTEKTEDTEIYRFLTCIGQNKPEATKRQILKSITDKFDETVNLKDIYIKVKDNKVDDVLLF